MATVRRHGNVAAFWGSVNTATGVVTGATVNANDKSAYASVGRSADQMLVYIKTSGASAFQVQVAASTGDNPDGTGVDIDESTLLPAGSAQWYDYHYQNKDTTAGGALGLITFTGAGAVAVGLPDWVGGYMRLLCTSGTAVTVTAGFEAWGD